MRYTLLFFVLLTSNLIFGQCDEYYFNELISGPNETVFPSGSPMRFCPKLRGLSLNGYAFDTYQWDGDFTQYITITKNGGIAGTLVLNLREKTLLVNLHGSPGKQKYSFSFTKEEYNNYFKNKEIKERELQNHRIQVKSQIEEKLNTGQIIEAAKIFESNAIDDKQLFDEIQNRIFKISLNRSPDDNEAFNILISKFGEDKFLNLSQGNYLLSSDTIVGLTLTENSTGQKIQLDKVVIEKVGKFDRINQFEKKIELKKTKTLFGVKLNSQWDGNLSNSGVSMRFFKADKKGKTLIVGGVKETPPSKYENIEIVPEGLKNVTFDGKLELKKGRLIYLNKVFFNGKEKFNKPVEEQEILELDWFYF